MSPRRDEISRRSILKGLSIPATLAPFGLRDRAPGAGAAPPTLTFTDAAQQTNLGEPYQLALKNLLTINTVKYDPSVYNRTGLLSDPPGTFFRAGGGYQQPWTRDAAINSWNAGNLLSPVVARNTLWSVCDRRTDGSLIVHQDNQWWDQVIWARGAWSHYLVTGDRAFLANAYQAVSNTLALAQSTRFNATYGLFRGPAVMQDGIAGYPAPPFQPGNGSSFVLDHPGADQIMCLSTNCIYAGALAAAAEMAGELGHPAAERAAFTQRAAALRTAINGRLWIPSQGRYGYFLHGNGTLDTHAETLGVAFALLLGVADTGRAAQLLGTHHRQPYGVVNVWPHFAQFSDAKPGRHEAVVWPMVAGMWAHAAARGGRVDLFGREMSGLAALVRANGNTFTEIYNATSGKTDGGWQVRGGSAQVHWSSAPDQTWSASAYLRMVYAGLFGMNFSPGALTFTPSLPDDWGTVRLTGVPYRGAALDVTLTGRGNRATAVTLDGTAVSSASVPATLTGPHTLAITLAP